MLARLAIVASRIRGLLLETRLDDDFDNAIAVAAARAVWSR